MFGGKKRRALEERGKQAPATLVEVRDTGMTVNDNPRVAMRLEVRPTGEQPFTVSKKQVVSRLQIPQPGAAVIIKYDPEDHENFELDVEAMAQANAQAVEAAAQASAAAGGGDGGAAADPLDRLKKLAELRDAGALTDSEFEAEKAKLLSSA
jgi:hypothetical protein